MIRSSTSPRSFGPFLHPAGLIPGWGGQIDWTLVPDEYLTSQFQITANGGESAGAVSITVDPIPFALKDQQILRTSLGVVVVSTDVPVGAVEIPVEATDFVIADNMVFIGQHPYAKQVSKRIPLGTVMAKLASGLMVPRAVRPGSETAFGFLVSDATSDSHTDAKSGYGVITGGTPIMENLCPDADALGDLPPEYKTEMTANGCAFSYVDYADNTSDLVA